MKHGFTYSDQYAKYLGLSQLNPLDNILARYNFNTVRICVYWNQTETKKGKFNFSAVDKQIKICKKHNTKVVLAVGRKAPRWPEFHEPTYIKKYLNSKQSTKEKEKYLKENLYEFLQKTIKKYKDENIVKIFQIENEPFFNFGISPLKISKEFYKDEIEYVKTLTTKPVMCSDSFDNGTYKNFDGLVNYLGLNLYFLVWSDTSKKYVKVGNTKSYFKNQSKNTNLNYIISELQAEPWGNGKGILDMTKEELNLSINSNQLIKNYNWAKDLNVKEVWFWGVEYWEYLVKQGDDSLQKTALKIIS
jgi:GH35 family endo-1,4-beta-xylanase